MVSGRFQGGAKLVLQLSPAPVQQPVDGGDSLQSPVGGCTGSPTSLAGLLVR
jgi:hypothetical protein